MDATSLVAVHQETLIDRRATKWSYIFYVHHVYQSKYAK